MNEEVSEKMERIRIKQVDAFSDSPFGGNPAGVVTDGDGLDERTMGLIAREMNLSETAFVFPSDRADFKIRFFTPAREVDLCGHATIAAFFSLHEEGRLDPSRSVFTQETKAGVLEVERSFREGRPVFTMTQARPRFEEVGTSGGDVARLLGVDAKDLLDATPLKISTGIWWLVVGMKGLEELQNLVPDQAAIRRFSARHGVVGLLPFCLETLSPDASFHMRAFAPAVGIDEDPVCGTGNGCIGAFIAHHRLLGGGEVEMRSEAGFEVGRPGQVFVTVCREGSLPSRVRVGGSAVTVLEGTMYLSGGERT